MLRVIPLGGLGEIGLNSMVLEHAGERLLIDCGLMFPRADQLGVEIIVPDFAYLKESPDAFQGLVLTHAHEDHLGALVHLLRELKVPVYGTPLTLAMARHRLQEAEITADLREIGPRTPFAVGTQFTVEPVRVAHSVPDAVGLVVKTASGTVVHSGDFKLDATPVDGQMTDLQRLGELGDEGVALLLSDSTNAEVPGWTGSERVVEEAFARHLAQARGRVVISLFGSHLHRVNHLLALAQRLGRRVVIAGRSLQRNTELGCATHVLQIPEGLVIPLEAVPHFPPEQLLVICTGAQAEPRSALMTMLFEDPGPLRIGKGDLVILSSRTIPGNEPAVSTLINRLLAKGARVITPAVEPGIHVSGHAAQDEQRKLIETVRPRHFVPIHGELRHLHRHRALAEDAGLPSGDAVVLTNGDIAELSGDGMSTLGRIAAGRLMMRRESLGVLTTEALAERRTLAEQGIVVVQVVLELGGGRVRAKPTVHARGLQGDEAAALSLASEGAQLALSELSEAARSDDELVREALIRGVRRVFKQLLGARPNVLPIVTRL